MISIIFIVSGVACMCWVAYLTGRDEGYLNGLEESQRLINRSLAAQEVDWLAYTLTAPSDTSKQGEP